MKKLHLLKTMLLLCALIVGSGTMWATDTVVTWNISGVNTTANNAKVNTTLKTSSITPSGASGTWTAVSDGNSSYADSSTGAQLGASSGRQFTGTITLSSTSIPSSAIVKSVTVSAKSNGSSTLSATVGGNSLGTSKTISGTTVTDYTISGSSQTGNAIVLTLSGTTANKYVNISKIVVTYEDAPAYTISTTVNNALYGSVSLSGTTITADPEDGYRVMNGSYGYSVTLGSATVAHEGYSNTLTVTPSSDCTVQVNFEAIPKYKVTFDAEGGICATESLTESVGGAGVTLPTASTNVTGWEFIGWAESKVTNTNTMPDLFAAGSTYYPTSATTLHAVYTLKETTSTFVRVTSVNQVEFAKSIVVVKNSDNYVLNHTKGTEVAAPTETNGEITAPANTIFTLSGDNTDGFVLTGASGTLSQTTVSTSSSNDRAIDWNGNNNQWKIEENANATNTFALSNATNVALEYYNGWKTEYSTSYNNRAYTAMKLYVPKSAYDSNPEALITPIVSFTSKDPVTLYLDGTTTNTNTATVTGVSKTINYSSSNTSVATVSSDGEVEAVGIGTATITASVDAELGVSAAAYDTYEVTVKSATTLAGIKAQATGSTAVDFTADLANDLVITYVNGSHAYLQSGNVAVYASCGNTEGWEAGKKFTGTISGKVKLNASEYQITAIDQTPVTGGVVPDAVEVNISDLTTDSYATYEGRKLAINGATISAALSSSSSTGGKISDGENTLNIYAPLTGITLTKDEKGNFIGFFGRNGNNLRYYMYAQSQFTKTHNAPVNQVMSFTNSSYNLDEETAAVTSFAGQEVTKTTVKGAVTYSIKDGSDDIITSLNLSTGAVVLNGDCGTATIVATAAYAEETDGSGHITPYPELSKQYTVTVRPRYTVTFSVNGETTALREESYNAGITVPANPSAIGSYAFRGWYGEEVAAGSSKPTFASLTASTNYKPTADITYYAVFAKETVGPEEEALAQTLQYDTWTYGGDTEDMTNYRMFGDGGYIQSASFDLSKLTKVIVYGGTYGGKDKYKYGTIDNGTTTWKDFELTGTSNTAAHSITGGTSLTGTGVLYIRSTCGSAGTNGLRVSKVEIYTLQPTSTYTDYRSSIVITGAGTSGESKEQPGVFYATFSSDEDVVFTSDVQVFAIEVSGSSVVKNELVTDDYLIVDESYNSGVVENGYYVPAGTGVMLQSTSSAFDYYLPASTASVVIPDNLLIAGTGSTPDDDEHKYYKLTYKNSDKDKLGFYWGADDGAPFLLKKGKAYLKLPKEVLAHSFVLFDDEETTGIKAIDNEKLTIDNCYDLSGRKVAQPTKGLYIVNGKKVVVK